jgi:hypothetical protein
MCPSVGFLATTSSSFFFNLVMVHRIFVYLQREAGQAEDSVLALDEAGLICSCILSVDHILLTPL